jgi:hypothetical protein
MLKPSTICKIVSAILLIGFLGCMAWFCPVFIIAVFLAIIMFGIVVFLACGCCGDFDKWTQL